MNEPSESRIKQLGDAVVMPHCDAGYMIGYLFEIGPVMAGGMGESPITHGEISGWQENTGIELDAWQARTLRRMSIAYLNESGAASEIDCPAPYQTDDMTDESREVVARKVKIALRNFIKKEIP